jgi:MFS family permease
MASSGASALVAFASYSLAAKHPTLIDVRVFARRSFGLSSVITFVGGFSPYALMFLLPLFYQQIRGETVLDTGLLLIPQGLGTMLFLVLSGRLAARLDGRFIVAGGVILTMIGVLPFALAGAHGGEALLLAAQFIQGIGLGATTLPVMTLAFASLSPAEAAPGSAAFSVVQRVGAPFGVAVIAVILQGHLGHAITAADALGAFTSTFWWILGLSAVPLFLAFFIRPGRPASAAPGE